MQHFKQNITEIPTYLDGIFRLFEIKQTDDPFPTEFIQEVLLNNKPIDVRFNDLSISDKLKYELGQRSKSIYRKIRIPQMKQINSLNAIQIETNFYKVYNAYHFKNKDGFLETDLTLEEYMNAKVISNEQN